MKQKTLDELEGIDAVYNQYFLEDNKLEVY